MRSPKIVKESVRGIGVAVITRVWGTVLSSSRLFLNVARWCTPNRCCSSTIDTAMLEKTTSGILSEPRHENLCDFCWFILLALGRPLGLGPHFLGPNLNLLFLKTIAKIRSPNVAFSFIMYPRYANTTLWNFRETQVWNSTSENPLGP